MIPRFTECLTAFVLGLTLAAVCRAETVYIDEAAFYSERGGRFAVTYRIDDSGPFVAETPLTGLYELQLKLRGTSVVLLQSFSDWEWIVQAEPTVKVVWK
jgi:hypothetical protein